MPRVAQSSSFPLRKSPDPPMGPTDWITQLSSLPLRKSPDPPTRPTDRTCQTLLPHHSQRSVTCPVDLSQITGNVRPALRRGNRNVYIQNEDKDSGVSVR